MRLVTRLVGISFTAIALVPQLATGQAAGNTPATELGEVVVTGTRAAVGGRRRTPSRSRNFT